MILAAIAVVAIVSFSGNRHHHQHLQGRFILRSNSGLIPGLVLVAAGALFFLNNLHIIYIHEWVRFWPAILIAAGIVKLVDSTYAGGKLLGGILTGVGALLLARSLGYIDFGVRDIWPLFLIGIGILMLGQRTSDWHMQFPDAARARVSTADRVKIDTVFGGAKRVVTNQDFHGGEVVSVFGGVELDLRQAGMIADSAVLEINAIFGGVELKIPRNWSAVVEGVGIFGGYVDNTIQPENPEMLGVKRLVVRGAAIFGGVEVKN